MSKINRTAAIAAGRLGHFIVLALFGLLGLGTALQAHAQAAAGDPPDRVARLSDASGQVWLFNQDDNEWVAVDRNRPLTTGDRLATDNDAHAEITLGTTTLRLDGATELEIVQLDDRSYRVHLHGGSVVARLRSAQSLAEFTLETDEGQFRVQAVGRYRFDHFDQASDLTVYNGQAVFEGRNSALPLATGQHAQFWLDAGGAPQYNMLEPARDAFAAWNDERERAENRPVAAVRYVSPEMTGGDELDRYGQWEQSPDYGPLWTPANVAVDWAPYSAGHWAWVRPWGWTWVDAAPWGFAPFHYGRWVNYRNRWCWAPGTYVARPVYAPALVAWIGGPRVGVSIGIGAGGPPVGWFPLAPHEVYVPSYRTSPRYVREINITHVTNVTNITTIVNNVNGAADRREFANRRYPNAVTVVPAGVLTARQQVGPAAVRLRADPQIRALVSDARPGPVMATAPVATPLARARLPEGQAPSRPPFQGRAPGVLAGRPGGVEGRPTGDAPRSEIRPGDRSNGFQGAPGARPAPPVAGQLPRPTPGLQNARPGGTTPALEAGRPEIARPAPAAPEGSGRPDTLRPATPARPSGDAIERPPVRGRIGREPGSENVAPPVRNVVPPPVVPRAEPAPGRLGDPRGMEPSRAAPPRPVEAVRPVEPARLVEPARVAEPPRAVETRPQRPVEAPRREEKREEKRDDRRDPKEPQK